MSALGCERGNKRAVSNMQAVKFNQNKLLETKTHRITTISTRSDEEQL